MQLFFSIFFGSTLYAQENGQSLDVMIIWLEEQELEGEQFEYFLGRLEAIQENPVNINSEDMKEFLNLSVITEIQYEDLVQHRENYGALLAVEELQSIPSWDMATIRRIRAFVKSNKGLDDLNITLKELLARTDYTVASSFSRFYPKSKGLSGDEPKYEGDPWRNVIRLRADYAYRISAGLILEKDQGEALFSKSNESYDHIGFFFRYEKPTKWIKQIVLGDYRVSMGQGLIIHNGFGGNKSSATTNIRKGGSLFRPHSSSSEFAFYRGVGTEFMLGKHLSLGAFYNRNKIDGNQILPDTSGQDGLEETFFTSIQNSGLHRTESEIADEHTLLQQSTGGRLGYSKKRKNINFNVLHQWYDSEIIPSQRPDNQFRFSGKELTNYSIDYNMQVVGVQVFGESAMSDNGRMAHMVGAQTGLSKELRITGAYRNYDRAYQSLQSKAFGETRDGYNEEGFYIGMEYQLHKQWLLSVYADYWRHPWLRYNTPSPTSGREYLAKLRFYKKRRVTVYALYKNEIKELGFDQEGAIDGIGERHRNQLRFHIGYKIGKGLEWRTRLEFNHVEFQNETSKGYLFYQDFLFKPKKSPVSFNGRIALFDTDDYDSRIYAYENNLLYTFSLPSYFDKGMRYYLNIRSRPFKGMTLEARYANTIYTNQTSVGSGNDEIEGKHKSELAFQIRYRF